jgi:predicted secreted Zn-dependent protease
MATDIRKGKSTLCITTGEIFISVKEAARAKNMSYASVHAVCSNRQSSHKGLVFCYMEDAPYKIETIARGIRMKNDTMLRKQLKDSQKKLEDARQKYEAAQAEYDAIAAQIGQ